MKTFLEHTVLCRDQKVNTSSKHRLIGEEPLSIRVEGKPYAVVMRTPGDELAHAAGFCLAEGIVDTPNDFGTISFCDDIDSNVVTVTIIKSRRDKIVDILDRRGFISPTSCRIRCQQIVTNLHHMIHPVDDTVRFIVGFSFSYIVILPVLPHPRHQTHDNHP